jgi:hypothetical protein
MPKALDKWTVYPHGPIEKVAENLWHVDARVPGAPITRTMVVVRLTDGRVIIHNAIALGDAEMKEIEAWGTPSFLIVPNGSHRLDSRIYKDRYPGLRVVGPPGAKTKIEEVVAGVETAPNFEDDTVRFEPLGGTGEREGVLSVKSSAGTTVVFTDALMNMQKLPGFGGFMMGLFGFTGPKPKVSAPSRMLLMKDKPALKSSLEKLAATPGLVRIEVAHGAPITTGPAEALRDAAAAL